MKLDESPSSSRDAFQNPEPWKVSRDHLLPASPATSPAADHALSGTVTILVDRWHYPNVYEGLGTMVERIDNPIHAKHCSS